MAVCPTPLFVTEMEWKGFIWKVVKTTKESARKIQRSHGKLKNYVILECLSVCQVRWICFCEVYYFIYIQQPLRETNWFKARNIEIYTVQSDSNNISIYLVFISFSILSILSIRTPCNRLIAWRHGVRLSKVWLIICHAVSAVFQLYDGGDYQ